MINQYLEKLGIKMTGEINHTYKVVVPFSGGKDSQSCLKLACTEYGADSVLALFCDTDFEHPITYKHVAETTEKYNCDLVTIKAGTVKDLCLQYKRLPGGGARFCTDRLKIRPSKFFYKFLAEKQGGFVVWLGMRSDESKERAKRYQGKLSEDVYLPHEVLKDFPQYLGKMGVMFRLPVIEWTANEIFNFLNGEENPLYSQGFKRVGCFPCLAGGEGEQVRAFYHDEIGKKHFAVAQEIADFSGREVLVSKRYYGQSPVCGFCMI